VEEVRVGVLRRSHNSFQMKHRKVQGEMWGGELNKRNYFKPRFQSDARLDVLLNNYNHICRFQSIVVLWKVMCEL
jgi:hypothetical protein